MSSLLVDVFVSPQTRAQPVIQGDTAFDWSPCASTLLRGPRSAVLVDTVITAHQNEALADWVESLLKPRNLSLTTIYITHGHADHFLGLPIFQSRFPGVRFVATSGTVEHMKQQIEPNFFAAFWGTFFPDGQLVEKPIVADPLPQNDKVIRLDGHELVPIECGHTDTIDSTVLWVPSLRLVVAGDVVYGDVHQSLKEANTEDKRKEWIAALKKVLSLKPETVVAGHKRPGGLDSVAQVHSTIAYIQDFQSMIENGITDQKAMYEHMMEKWGGRVNSHALSGSCAAAEKMLHSAI